MLGKGPLVDRTAVLGDRPTAGFDSLNSFESRRKVVGSLIHDEAACRCPGRHHSTS